MAKSLVFPLGPFVRRERVARGWTQVELARAMGVSRSLVANLEGSADAGGQVRVGTVGRVARAFGMGVAEVMGQVFPVAGPRSRWAVPAVAGDISERLVQIRAARGLTAIAVSRRAGIHQNVYLTLESRRAGDLTVEMLVALARAFRVGAGQLADSLLS